MASLDQRAIRHVEGQPRDDDVAKTAAAHVHALPEARRAHQDRSLIVAKAAQKHPGRSVTALHEHGIPCRAERRLHAVGHLVQHVEAGEQDECASVRRAHVLDHARRQPIDVRRMPGIGQRRVDVDLHLGGVIERTAQVQRLGLFTTQPRRDVREIAAPRGQRGRGQNDGDLAAKQVLLQQRADLDGQAMGADLVGARPASAGRGRRAGTALQPVHAPVQLLLEQDLHGTGDVGGPLRVAVELELVGLVGDACPQQLEHRAQLAHRRAQRIGYHARRPDASVGRTAAKLPLEQRVEERLGAVTAQAALLESPVHQRIGRIGGVKRDQEPPLHSRLVEQVQQVHDARPAQARPEVLRRDLLHPVGLVQDHMLVCREKPDASAAQSEVGEEERVVADEQVAGGHPAPGVLVEALVVGRAALAHAVVRVGPGEVPHLRPGKLGQRRQAPIARRVRPVRDDVQRLQLGPIGEQPVLPLRGQLQPANRKVVAAALDEDRAELLGNNLAQKRQIPLEQLLLKIDRVGRDHDPLAVLDDALDGGQQVRERLADASPRFDQQAAALIERPLDRRRHRLLLGPHLESVEPACDRAVARQQPTHIERHGCIVRTDHGIMAPCYSLFRV